tara:strand:+ start:198 stop:2051 length:1854 start_codon:yes stop_codon:yes gene_type:complete
MRLDQDIEQRVNAYRGNPQALQQRYAANQELLDLLALQRLKSEKDEAARQVQMEMQENPQTIKQQRERQLVEMTKQDLVNQTAGILQNRRSRQQKNLQRVARQGAAGPRQMQFGLGALAQRQPQRPQQVAMRQPQRPQQAPMGRMMKAAEGGIVAFAEGLTVNGEITQAEIDEYRRSLGRQNPRAQRLITDDEIRARIERERAPKPAMTSTRRGLRPTSATLPDAEIDGAILAQQNDVELGKEAGRTEVIPLSATGEQSDNGAQSTSDDIEPKGILARYEDKDALVAPNIDVSDPYAGADEMLETVGIDTTVDPKEAGIAQRNEAARYLGRGAKRDRIVDYLQDLKDMDARQQDPDKLRRERTSAFLRGTAGTGSFGQTMAAGSGAMAAERQSQEKSERERLLKRIGIDANSMKLDVDIGTQALTDGRTMTKALMDQRTQAAEVFSAYRGQNFDLAIAQANNEYNANKDNVKNFLEAANIQFTQALQETMAAADREVRAMKELRELVEYKETFIKNHVDNDPAVKEADSIAITNPDRKLPNGKTAREVAREARALSEAAAYAKLSKSNLIRLEDAFMEVLKSAGASALPSESAIEKAKQSITPSKEEQSVLNRNLPR